MNKKYTGPAIALHWIMALGLLGMLFLGIWMTSLPDSDAKFKLYDWHGWTGVTMLVLALCRLAWRLTHRPPELPGTLPDFARHAAETAHNVLYVLMLAQPIVGWLMNSANGYPTSWFGVLTLPTLIPKDEAFGHQLQVLHGALGYSLLALIGVHVAAALKHQLIDKTGLLSRLLPTR